MPTVAALCFSAELSPLSGFTAACGATQSAALADGFSSRLLPHRAVHPRPPTPQSDVSSDTKQHTKCEIYAEETTVGIELI